MLVKEIMTKNVVTIEANNTVFDACKKYKDYKVGCLVVEDNGFCVGIVTERDIIERTICVKKDPQKTKVSEIMSAGIKTVYALDSVDKAIEIMKQYKFKKLPVISNNDIVGIITVTDISNAKSEMTKRFMETWVKTKWQD